MIVLKEAWSAFNWFLATMILKIVLTILNGGCRTDCILKVNENQGGRIDFGVLDALVEIVLLGESSSTITP